VEKSAKCRYWPDTRPRTSGLVFERDVPASARAANDVVEIENRSRCRDPSGRPLRRVRSSGPHRVAAWPSSSWRASVARAAAGHARSRSCEAQLVEPIPVAALFSRRGKSPAHRPLASNVCHTLRFGTEHAIRSRDGARRGRHRCRDVCGTRDAPARSSPPRSRPRSLTSAEALHSAHGARDDRGRAHRHRAQTSRAERDGRLRRTVKLLDFGVASTSSERATDHVENSHVTVRARGVSLARAVQRRVTRRALDVSRSDRALRAAHGRTLVRARPQRRVDARDRAGATALVARHDPSALRDVLDRALAQEPRIATPRRRPCRRTSSATSPTADRLTSHAIRARARARASGGLRSGALHRCFARSRWRGCVPRLRRSAADSARQSTSRPRPRLAWVAVACC